MALASPRFKTHSRLEKISNGGRTLKKGSRGRSVHLVQMALIDLGHLMPKSTQSKRYSPDGKFGSETRDKLKEFQKKNNITETGEIDRDTILALDHFCRDYKHRIRLHFRSISLTRAPFEDSLQSAIKVYGQYGIKIEFGSGMSLMLSEAEEQKFNRVSGECNWVISTGEMNELHSKGGATPTNEISVYYVKRFDDRGLLGCGGHAPNRPACTVAAKASKWDTAHEVCHVLLTSSFDPVHINNRRNLMHPTASRYSTIPVLTDKQITKIRNNPCCVSI